MYYNKDLNRAYFKLNGFWRDTNQVPKLVDDWLTILSETKQHHTVLLDLSELREPPKEVGEIIGKLLEASSAGCYKITALIPEENSVVKLAVNRWVKDANVENIFESFSNAKEAERWLGQPLEEEEQKPATRKEVEKLKQINKIEDFKKKKEEQVKRVKRKKERMKSQKNEFTTSFQRSVGNIDTRSSTTTGDKTRRTMTKSPSETKITATKEDKITFKPTEKFKPDEMDKSVKGGMRKKNSTNSSNDRSTSR